MSPAPWVGRRHSFAGWVPNIHSHLSFSLIGVGRGPDVTPMTPAYRNRLGRLVCVMERRETDDFLAPAWLSRKYRPEATQHFLMVGRTEEVQTPVGPEQPGGSNASGSLLKHLRTRVATRSAPPAASRSRVQTAADAQGMLRGNIHVMFWQKDAGLAATQTAFIGRLRTRILTDEGVGGVQRTDESLDALPGEVAKEVAAHAANAVTLDFALFRTGEIRIWYGDEAAARLDAVARVEIARQSYFFVKDMVHHHVHHDPKSDQITPLTDVGGQRSDEGEEHWRRDTAWSLSRAVDALARRGKLQDLREAMGILAYADAFQKSLLLYRRRADDPSTFEQNSAAYRYDYAHIRESLKVQLEQVTARRTVRAQMIVAGLAGSLAGTSLLASVISAHNGAIKPKFVVGTPVLPGVADRALQLLAAMPLIPTLACGAFLWFATEQFLSEDRIGAKRARGRKAVQAVRGAFNSMARRRPEKRDGAWVQRRLEWFYLLLAAAVAVLMIVLLPWVAAAGRQADALLRGVVSPPWQAASRAPAAGSDAGPARTGIGAAAGMPKPKPTRSSPVPSRTPAGSGTSGPKTGTPRHG